MKMKNWILCILCVLLTILLAIFLTTCIKAAIRYDSVWISHRGPDVDNLELDAFGYFFSEIMLAILTVYLMSLSIRGILYAGHILKCPCKLTLYMRQKGQHVGIVFAAVLVACIVVCVILRGAIDSALERMEGRHILDAEIWFNSLVSVGEIALIGGIESIVHRLKGRRLQRKGGVI